MSLAGRPLAAHSPPATHLSFDPPRPPNFAESGTRLIWPRPPSLRWNTAGPRVLTIGGSPVTTRLERDAWTSLCCGRARRADGHAGGRAASRPALLRVSACWTRGHRNCLRPVESGHLEKIRVRGRASEPPLGAKRNASSPTSAEDSLED